MNIIVIGLGSMGKRRIRLLQQYNREVEALNIIGLDMNRERCQNIEQEYSIDTYLSLSDAITKQKIDCAIVSTSPDTHSQLIKECLENDLHVFSELNLNAKGYEENNQLAKEKKKVLFLSSTFLYRKEIQYMKQKISNKSFHGSYRYHVGQYLPEWHPWEQYTEFFVGKKETNGCREIFAIELPWLTDIFGDICKIYSIHSKVSNLQIDYDDSYQIIIEHSSGVIGNIVVDIVTPKTGRSLEIWGENFYIGWEGTPDTLVEYCSTTKKMKKVVLYEQIAHEKGYNQSIVENAYYDEIVDFINCIQKEGIPKYSFERDKKVLNYIDEIES